jgi:hypothetical protein
VTRRAVLAASIAALIAAVSIAVSGGFVTSVGGVRVSARSWAVPAAATGALLAAWVVSAWRAGALRDDLAWLEQTLESRGHEIGLAVSLATCVVALSFATYSASGADASGYLSQAAMWSRFESRVPDPLVMLPDWPLPAAATAPLGWRPAPDRGWQVPTYAPGLPWLMAVPYKAAGLRGGVWVVAVGAGVAVWAAGATARRLGGSTAALFASILLATSPTFLIHAFQPMSDVPVTAAWAVCWWLLLTESAPGAGLAAAIAVAVRPNLAPLAAIPWAVVMRGRVGVGRVRAGIRFATPVALAGALIALMQWRWYGSPIRSGYGSPGELFDLANIAPNVRLYASWLWEAERALVYAIVAAVACRWGLAPLLQKRGRFCDGEGCREPAAVEARHTPVAGLLVFAAGVIVAYLVYAVFEVWTYVRFLLPALAVLAALSAAVVAQTLGRMPAAARAVVAIALAILAVATGLHTARALGVFQIAAATARARDAAVQLQGRLGSRAVLLAAEQSGSMRYATGRPIVRWDLLDSASLGATLAVLDARGYEVWWVLDQFEEPLVRTRFAGVADAALDRAPDIEVGPLMRTRAWRVR